MFVVLLITFLQPGLELSLDLGPLFLSKAICRQTNVNFYTVLSRGKKYGKIIINDTFGVLYDDFKHMEGRLRQ